MSAEQRIEEELEFIESCVQLELLDAPDAESLRSALGDDSRHIAQEAVFRGLLTPADVDIVQSLQRPTRVIPGYQILGLVGRGGMGVVYRARQLDLDRIVALKTILISNVSSSTASARFEREAKALARLQHPNIVQALNFGKHEGRYYFAMEFASGRTCEQAIRAEGVIRPEKAWFIVRQVASGLLHAFRQNLIHRDIKPANLILVPPPEGSSFAHGAEIVKIADFGLALFADSSPDQMKLTTGDKIMGSPAYMSLEQFGFGPVDFRSDMYALGATAWHLLFGSPPFRAGSIAEIVRQKSEPLVIDQAALPVVLPEDQMRLLAGLLDPEPSRRPQTYEQLIEAIDQLDTSDAGSSRPDPGLRSEAARRMAISEQPTAVLHGAADSTAAVDPNSSTQGSGSSTQGSGSSTQGSGGIRDAPTQTVNLPSSLAEPRSGRGKWLLLAGILGASVVAIGFVQSRPPSRGPRAYTRVAASEPLFDGVTLQGWDVGGSMVGAWNTVEAPDASTAIACTTRQGALTRQIPDTPNPRISLFVWLQAGSGPVDIDFAYDPVDPSDVRGCLRLTASTIDLGEKTTDFGDLDGSQQTDAPASIHNRFHVVYLERQPSDWFVFLEEELVGTLPVERIGRGGAIRLVVRGSDRSNVGEPQAFFADVQLDDLRGQ